MSFLLSSAVKDLRRRLADPTALLIWMGIPLLLGGLMSLVVGRQAASPSIHVLLADQDDSLLSRLLAGAEDQGASSGTLKIEKVELAQGRARIDAGEATALLIIPEGFSAAVLQDQPAQLALVTNPAQRILPEVVEEGLALLVEGSFYAQRVIGDPMRARLTPGAQGGEASEAAVAALSVDLQRRFALLEKTLRPPRLKLEVDGGGDGDASGGFDFGRMFLPALLFMSLLFVSQGMSDDVWREKAQGTLRRAACLPRSLGLGVFLAGKVLAATALMAAVSLVGLAAATVVFDFDIAVMPLALVWCAFSGTCFFTYFLLVQLSGSTQRGGSVLTTMVMFPSMMLGGSFFPFEMMPAWMAAIGQRTPNGLGLMRLKEILAGTADLQGLLLAALLMGLPAAAVFYICLRRVRGRFLVA